MPKIRIGNGIIIKACERLMKYHENTRSTTGDTYGNKRDGHREEKKIVKDIKEMAEYAMSVFGETILDHKEYKMLEFYLKKGVK